MHLFLLLVLLLVVVVVVGFALVAVSKLQKSPSRPLAESNSKLSPNSGLTKNQSLKQRQQKLYKENNSPKSRVASFFAQLEQRNYCIAVLRCHTEQVVCFAFHPKVWDCVVWLFLSLICAFHRTVVWYLVLLIAQ
jgi:hypothetical protein